VLTTVLSVAGVPLASIHAADQALRNVVLVKDVRVEEVAEVVVALVVGVLAAVLVVRVAS